MAQYVIYVYEADDFVAAPPDEQNAVAVGSPPFSLTLKPDAKWTKVVVEDNEGDFGEEINGPTQSIVEPVTLNGVTYNAGDNIVSAYDLINSTSGHQITSFHVGTGIDGYTVGPVTGIVSTQPLVPGQTYTFDTNRTSYNQNNPYSQYVCFTRGAMIRMQSGFRRIETLTPGDRVWTLHNGVQAIRWIGSRRLMVSPKDAPVLIARGALSGLLKTAEVIPARDMVVSPQHRLHLSGPRCEMLFGVPEALVAAKALLGVSGVRRAVTPTVEYFHMLFDRHQVVEADGCLSESFHPGAQGEAVIGDAARTEILSIFPELATGFYAYGGTACPVLSVSEAQVLLDAAA